MTFPLDLLNISLYGMLGVKTDQVAAAGVAPKRGQSVPTSRSAQSVHLEEHMNGRLPPDTKSAVYRDCDDYDEDEDDDYADDDEEDFDDEGDFDHDDGRRHANLRSGFLVYHQQLDYHDGYEFDGRDGSDNDSIPYNGQSL